MKEIALAITILFSSCLGSLAQAIKGKVVDKENRPIEFATIVLQTRDSVFINTTYSDSLGYFYFVDRIGDTFRWKGENVATSEVAEALSLFPGVKEANVYGVKVGDLDGKAGMAAVVAGPELDLANLPAYLESHLPAYARPLFIRILGEEMEITGTFKHRKVELVKEGVDPATISDPIFWLDPRAGAYKPLTAADYAALMAGDIKV